MHYAARKNNVALLTKLIDTEYFDINARDIKGYTAADYSIKADNVDCLRLLINRGATDSGYVDKLNTGKAKFVEQATMFQTELSDHNELVILTGEDIANNVLDM